MLGPSILFLATPAGLLYALSTVRGLEGPARIAAIAVATACGLEFLLVLLSVVANWSG